MMTQPLSISRLVVLLLLATAAVLFSSCAPPRNMIATLTQLPLTPTRVVPTRKPTATPDVTLTPAFSRTRPAPATEAPVAGPGSTRTPSPAQTRPVQTSTPARPGLPVLDEEKGQVLVNGEVVFDVEKEQPGCAVHWISFSPTYEHFLVSPNCIEGINSAYLFSIDGSEKTKITEKEDFMQDSIHTWSPDGQQILYFRTNTLMGDDKTGRPTEGLVIYNISDGTKEVILSSWDNPDFWYPTFLRWSPDGKIIAFINNRFPQDKSEINLIYPDGSGWQILDEFPGTDSSDHKLLEWKQLGGSNLQLNYSDTSGEIIRSYPIAP